MANPANEDQWVVDVVLRANGHANHEHDVVAAVGRALPDSPQSPAPTSSFDMDPPDGSIGVSCLVSAATAGRAVDLAVDLVARAARDVTNEDLPVWDVRAVPLSAVLVDEVLDDARRSSLWLRKRRRK